MTPAEREARNKRIVTLYLDGHSMQVVARKTRVAYKTVLRVLKTMGVPSRPAGWPPRDPATEPLRALNRRANQLARELVTVQNAAQELTLDRSYFHALCREGRVPGVLRVGDTPGGGAWLILREAVEYLKEHHPKGTKW